MKRFYQALRYVVMGLSGWVAVVLYFVVVAAANALAASFIFPIAFLVLFVFAAYGWYKSVWLFYLWVRNKEDMAK